MTTFPPTVWVTPEGRPEVDKALSGVEPEQSDGQGQAADGEAKSASHFRRVAYMAFNLGYTKIVSEK